MEKYIVKLAGREIYLKLFIRDEKTCQSSRHRRRDGLKGEEFICYQGGEFINTFENFFTQVSEGGKKSKGIYAHAVYKIVEDYEIHQPEVKEDFILTEWSDQEIVDRYNKLKGDR